MSGKSLAATTTIPSQAARYRDCPQHRCCGERLRVTHHSNSGDSSGSVPQRARHHSEAQPVVSAVGRAAWAGNIRPAPHSAPNDGWRPPNARRAPRPRARGWGGRRPSSGRSCRHPGRLLGPLHRRPGRGIVDHLGRGPTACGVDPMNTCGMQHSPFLMDLRDREVGIAIASWAVPLGPRRHGARRERKPTHSHTPAGVGQQRMRASCRTLGPESGRMLALSESVAGQ